MVAADAAQALLASRRVCRSAVVYRRVARETLQEEVDCSLGTINPRHPKVLSPNSTLDDFIPQGQCRGIYPRTLVVFN